jgi:hypothetical protein
MSIGPRSLLDLCGGGLHLRGVRHVGLNGQRLHAASFQFLQGFLQAGGFPGQNGNRSALPAELTGDRSAHAGRAAGHDHPPCC